MTYTEAIKLLWALANEKPNPTKQEKQALTLVKNDWPRIENRLKDLPTPTTEGE